MISTLEQREFPKIESAADILTVHGLTADKEWIAGVPLNNELITGKEEEKRKLRGYLDKDEVALLAGGHRTGKSSILASLAETMISEGVVGVWAKLESPITAEYGMDETVTSAKARAGSKPLIITADEPGEEGLLFLKKLKGERHKIVIAVNGDYQHSGRFNPHLRKALSELVGNNIVVNRAFTDEEIRRIIRGKKAVFSQPVEDYLVQESGGHAMLCQLLCDCMLDIGREVAQGSIASNEVQQKFEEAVLDEDSEVDNLFQAITEFVEEVGINPWTLEFAGEPGINTDIYVNSLPRPSSRIYKLWLEKKQGKQVIHVPSGHTENSKPKRRRLLSFFK